MRRLIITTIAASTVGVGAALAGDIAPSDVAFTEDGAIAESLTGVPGNAANAPDIMNKGAGNCIACHQAGGAGEQASGFSMVSYEDLMKGTQFGPMIVPGDSLGSNMLVLMEGRADPSISMPHGNMKPVPQAEIETIRRWIEQGAKNN